MGCVQSFLKTDADLESLYTLDKCVGRGVEGEVFLATCTATQEQVAIKLIARGPDLGLGPEKVRRELQLQARLDHVNIVELRQIILTRRHLAIVMTYEGGGDLHAYASRYTLNEDVARYFFRQIVEGLAYCHRSHIAHRDLKLANFLLTTDKPMRVKLCDFGCARHWDTSTKRVPEKRIGRFTTFAGTPAYMSPQVLQSAFYPTNTYDAVEADVWALGIVLCHLFFGKHTPFWMEPNAFQNEVVTMQARIEAMRKQNWVDSDEFVKANVTSLTPELRDLLDKIFVADEFKRITMQGIKDHPWYTKELPPFLQDALDAMDKEQALRESLLRATVSVAANRHDTAMADTGDFATIDLLVDLAQKHRKMPGGGEETTFTLDMAHMDLGPLSHADSVTESILGPPSSLGHASTATGGGGTGAAAGGLDAAAGTAAAWGGGVEGATSDPEGTHHSTLSYSSSLDRVAASGDRSYHYATSGGGGGGYDAAAAAAAATAAQPLRLKKTLSLVKSPSGLTLGSYALSPCSIGGGGGGGSLVHAGSSAAAGAPTGRGSGGGWLAGKLADREANRMARSVHGGEAFFKEAARCNAEGGSVHGRGVRGGGGGGGAGAAAAACTSRTVHGGTEHAAARSQGFYQGG